MSTKYDDHWGLWHSRSNESSNATVTKDVGTSSVRILSGARMLFGAIFLFDGLLKWYLIQQSQMQGVVQGFGVDLLSNNWLLVGVLVAVGETAAGAALLVGLFQRPAALGAAGIMLGIWSVGGYAGWGQPGYTDPGGDLMLALVFVVLAFAPTAYGLASRLRLRERWASDSFADRARRLLVA
jgi:uncharacterized membrane protein YphA (DoxX/SURF4 family)